MGTWNHEGVGNDHDLIPRHRQLFMVTIHGILSTMKRVVEVYSPKNSSVIIMIWIKINNSHPFRNRSVSSVVIDVRRCVLSAQKQPKIVQINTVLPWWDQRTEGEVDSCMYFSVVT